MPATQSFTRPVSPSSPLPLCRLSRLLEMLYSDERFRMVDLDTYIF